MLKIIFEFSFRGAAWEPIPPARLGGIGCPCPFTIKTLKRNVFAQLTSHYINFDQPRALGNPFSHFTNMEVTYS